MAKKSAPQHDPETGEILDVQDYFERAVRASQELLDKFGHETPDPTPMAPPVGYVRQPTMVDIIRQQIQSHKLAQEAEAAGLETWEEANDFDIPDDPIPPGSPWEEIYDPEPPQPRLYNAQEQLDPERPRPPKPAEQSASKPAQEPVPPSDGPPAPTPPAPKTPSPTAS